MSILHKLSYLTLDDDGRFLTVHNDGSRFYPKIELRENGTVQIGCFAIYKDAWDTLRRRLERGEVGFLQHSDIQQDPV